MGWVLASMSLNRKETVPAGVWLIFTVRGLESPTLITPRLNKPTCVFFTASCPERPQERATIRAATGSPRTLRYQDIYGQE